VKAAYRNQQIIAEQDKAFLRVALLFVEKNLFWRHWRYEMGVLNNNNSQGHIGPKAP
jgi:hypothetical protein